MISKLYLPVSFYTNINMSQVPLRVLHIRPTLIILDVINLMSGEEKL